MLQGVYSEMAQNPTGQGIESGAAGVSGRCNYDVDSEGTGEAGKEVMRFEKGVMINGIEVNMLVLYKE